ncbi:hypothetical protein [Diplocloster modestus]|uniref:Uncharacterized protein n=1 Tax=Diplocloster modestus TaxID=2850322 RepID=A0ABS6K239_9FIRM|nr:hypothetical protein [Diplocloster modestus]MBU9724531.1 hypothetical protein [Diplocloster modestus]
MRLSEKGPGLEQEEGRERGTGYPGPGGCPLRQAAHGNGWRTEAAVLAVILGCGLAPAAAKQNQDGEFGNRAYSPRTHDAFSVQRPLQVGGERRPASRIHRPDSVKQLRGCPMPRITAKTAASVLHPFPCAACRRGQPPGPG